MLTFSIFDHLSYWSSLGLAVRYTGVALTVLIGVFVYRKTRVWYFFGMTWFLLFVPGMFVGIADFLAPKAICMEMGGAITCNGWNYLWLTLTIPEVLLVWIPLIGSLVPRWEGGTTQ